VLATPSLLLSADLFRMILFRSLFKKRVKSVLRYQPLTKPFVIMIIQKYISGVSLYSEFRIYKCSPHMKLVAYDS